MLAFLVSHFYDAAKTEKKAFTKAHKALGIKLNYKYGAMIDIVAPEI